MNVAQKREGWVDATKTMSSYLLSLVKKDDLSTVPLITSNDDGTSSCWNQDYLQMTTYGIFLSLRYISFLLENTSELNLGHQIARRSRMEGPERICNKIMGMVFHDALTHSTSKLTSHHRSTDAIALECPSWYEKNAILIYKESIWKVYWRQNPFCHVSAFSLMVTVVIWCCNVHPVSNKGLPDWRHIFTMFGPRTTTCIPATWKNQRNEISLDNQAGKRKFN